MSNILVSVYIPTYNDIHYLRECVKSVLSQSYKHLEIVIADDGSRDGTEIYIKNLMKLDSRVKYFKSHKNEGQLISHRKYINECRGEILTILQSDDFYSDRLLIEKSVQKFATDEKLSMTWSRTKMIYPPTRKSSFIGGSNEICFYDGLAASKQILQY